MQLKPSRREIKTIDLLPLINVVFLLILFVLIAGRPTTNHPGGLEVAETMIESQYKGAPFAVHLREDDLFAAGRQVTFQVSDVTALGLVEQGLPLSYWPVGAHADRWNSAAPWLRREWKFAKTRVSEGKRAHNERKTEKRVVYTLARASWVRGVSGWPVCRLCGHPYRRGRHNVFAVFGPTGRRQTQDSVVVSVPENIDLQLEATPPDDLREAEAELDLSELLNVPLDTDFNDLMMDNAQMAAIAPPCRCQARLTRRAMLTAG